MQIKTKIVSCHTADSKPVKQEVNGTVILPPLVFPGLRIVSQGVVFLSIGLYNITFDISCKAIVFAIVIHFDPSLIFAYEVRSLPS